MLTDDTALDGDGILPENSDGEKQKSKQQLLRA